MSSYFKHRFYDSNDTGGIWSPFMSEFSAAKRNKKSPACARLLLREKIDYRKFERCGL
jgi:hypothetical protein